MKRATSHSSILKSMEIDLDRDILELSMNSIKGLNKSQSSLNDLNNSKLELDGATAVSRGMSSKAPQLEALAIVSPMNILIPADEFSPMSALLKNIDDFSAKITPNASDVSTEEIKQAPSSTIPLVRKQSERQYYANDMHESNYYGINFAFEASIADKFEVCEKELAETSNNKMDFKRGIETSVEVTQGMMIKGMQTNISSPSDANQPNMEEERAKAIALRKPKRAIDNVDYSEIFDLDRLGDEFGLYSWRIENLTPIMQDEPNIYCPKDCYMILFTEEDSPPQIWSWIGKDAEMDKRFCCALFAVALRDSLVAECRIIRIEQTVDGEDEDEINLKSVLNNCTLCLMF
jgi:hypothetical protein